MAQQQKQAEALSGRRNKKAKDAFQLAHMPKGRSGPRKDVGQQIHIGRTGTGAGKSIERQMKIR